MCLSWIKTASAAGAFGDSGNAGAVDFIGPGGFVEENPSLDLNFLFGNATDPQEKAINKRGLDQLTIPSGDKTSKLPPKAKETPTSLTIPS